MEWNPPKFKILGILFTNDLKDCEVLHFRETFSEIRALYQIWLKRQITPLGRIAVLKSLTLSKNIHLWDCVTKSTRQSCWFVAEDSV